VESSSVPGTACVVVLVCIPFRSDSDDNISTRIA
jgi:hypothetical protein